MKNFTPNQKGMRELLNADFVQRDMNRRANNVKDRAASIAPVDTGTLAASHVVIDDKTDRARSVVASTTGYALVVESKTGYLSRSLEAGK